MFYINAQMSKTVLETTTLPFHPLALEVSTWEGRSGFPFLFLQDISQPIQGPTSGSPDLVTPTSTSRTITTTVPSFHNKIIGKDCYKLYN